MTPKEDPRQHPSSKQSRKKSEPVAHYVGQLRQESLAGALNPPELKRGAQMHTVQRLMDFATFKQSTDLNLNRKSIAVIDDLLKEYHKFKLDHPQREFFAYRDDEKGEGEEKEGPLHEKEVGILERLKTAINLYISEKGEDHVRVPPVKRLLDDVVYTLGYHARKLQTPEQMQGMVDHNPNYDNTVKLLLRVSYAPSALPTIKDYFTKAADEFKGKLLAGLASKNHLQYILDDTFIDGDGLAVIKTFPKGKDLSADQRLAIDQCIAKGTTLATAKALFAHRFDFTEVEIDGLNVGEETAGDEKVGVKTDWDLTGIKRAYNIQKTLPDGHAASNASLKKMKRFKGTGGWFGKTDTIAVGYDNINYNKGDSRTLSDKWHGRGRDVFAGKNYFDQTVRHEVGHAVDRQHDFSGKYCIGNAAGGDWKVYSQPINLVKDYMDLNESDMSKHGAADGIVKMYIGQILSGDLTVEKAKEEVIKHMTNLSGIAKLTFDEKIVKSDPIFQKLIPTVLKKPWSSTESPSWGGRTFVWSNAQSMSSYDPSARAKQVSNYQFRAPAEWFAEAYAAYYMPDNSVKGYGSALKDADATTFTYFENNVDKAL